MTSLPSLAAISRSGSRGDPAILAAHAERIGGDLNTAGAPSGWIET
jgi:hypothetical protein